MGRSKFPGKPSKHTNRKRVNVLPPSGDSYNIDGSNSLTVECVVENKQQNEEAKEKSSNISPSDSVINTKVSIKRRLTRKMQASLRSKNASKRNLLSKLCGKSGIKSKITTAVTRNGRLTRKAVRAYSNLSSSCRSVTQKEANGLVGKFVLPTRSVHSSRVIKPNKRFINVDLNDSLTVKKKIISKRHCIKPMDEKSELNRNDCISENQGSCITGHESDGEKTSFTNGRVVLRQARLKLHTQTPSGPEGPFSSSSNNSSPPGTVTCGVCGAVRFYRFVKQARKFSIYSCESCRKFISKMIKRQTCGKNISNTTLVCHKGQGMCHVPPIVRSQQWKLIRCAYRARCPACWLKMCLRSFQMPMSLKHSLAQLLPKNMQGADIIFNNTLPLLWQTNIECTEARTEETTSIKQRPVRYRNPKPQVVPNPPPPNSDIKRQKVDLKGPRVKHVCRSASIVLGQPLATFNNESDKKKIDTQETVAEIKVSDESRTNCVNSTEIKQNNNLNNSKSDSNSNLSETDSSDSDKTNKLQFLLSENTVTVVKRDRHQKNVAQSSVETRANAERKRNSTEAQQGILIDFWEGYDPDDVCQNGFCLIASEQFPMPAVCFLCGSAGREALLYCSACCEPYHSFCLEQIPPLNNNNTRQCVWLCPRCTTCSECNQTDRHKINCQKCLKAYHPECFNKKWNSDDRPTVCSKCLRCKSCGVDNITKFVGNLPLCMMCFKLRKKGNFCPLCQHCYDENECCAKMMECAKCNKWVHAKCENLTEEQYQMLSLLPESIEYLCGLCSKETIPQWRTAIDCEIRASFNHVLRLLSKNKTARNMLKWSPLNNHTPSNKAITNVRKLNFSDSDADLDNNNCSKDIPDINKIYSFEENELQAKIESENLLKNSSTLTMVDIKNKLNSNDYYSVNEFNREMAEALNSTHSEQLLKIYQSIFHNVFPWFKNSQLEEEPKKLDSTSSDEFLKSATNKEDEFTPIDCLTADSRVCSFCKSLGDGLSHEESRLLYCGQNEWVHANCALWSSEVYEEIDGSLQNVHSALSRGRLIKCATCKQKGASVGCCFKGCYETYHFICARSSKCHFLHDKTVYCSTHELPKSSSILTSPKDFDIHRSVYVELDRKKRKYAEIEKIHFMVGSLCVTNLGKINPLVSDGVETIIPLGFVCTRLFWSTIEPWKLVSYNISTSLPNTQINNLYVDKNFTVDHTLSKSTVEKLVREINVWQKDVDKKRTDILEFEDEEEPQNGADFLSPELTDAILEELPHDLLDGISVQDIFPKLLSYDDLINMDFKSDLNNTESITESLKKSEVEDDSLDLDVRNCRELRRSKSEIMPPQFHKMDCLSKSRSQQRSCSLTLSCKLDSSLSPAMKKRKIGRENNMFLQLLQVDGNFDDSSSSECGSPTGISGINPWESRVSEEPVTCEKCQCTYRTQASYKRHLDTCEVLCTSESDSEMSPEQDNSIILQENIPSNSLGNPTIMVDVNEIQPVVLTSYESYQNEIHTSVLNTQTFVTSKSTSELISVPQPSEMVIQNLPQPVEQKTILAPQIQTIPVNTVAPMTINPQSIAETAHAEQSYSINHPTIAISDPISIPNNQPTQFCVNQTVPLCMNQPLTLQPTTMSVNPPTSIINTGNPLLNQISINQASSIAINQLNQPSTIQQPIEFQPQSVTIQSVPFTNNVTPILNVAPPQNQFSLNGKIITNPIVQTVNVPTTHWIKSAPKPTVIAQKTIKPKARSRTIAAKRTPHFEEAETIILPPGNSSGPSVIVQHLPSTNFVPTFVDAFQQQSGQNLQYLATITPQVNTQPLVQLQPEGNLISIVPGIQPTMIIQQPRVLENQLVLDSNGSLGWATPQTVQPVYYGFETIVQNTVMQSQQFLPTTMPGVLTANSSYSTTTQVFQTSKLEPVLDVASNSFVLVNSNQLVSSQPIEVPQYSQTQPVSTVVNNVLPPPEIKPTLQTVKFSQPITSHKPKIITTPTNSNSITLPTAPFVHEQGIPTNIVTPTPKPMSTLSRPMSRVLPMPTNIVKEIKKPDIEETKKVFVEEPKKPIQIKLEQAKIIPVEEPNKIITIANVKLAEPKIAVELEIEKPKLVEKILEEKLPPPIMEIKVDTFEQKIIEKVEEKIVQKENAIDTSKNNDTSLKLVFQKQGQDGTYKISNNFTAKQPVQVAPFKPIKSSPPQNLLQPVINKQDKPQEEKITTEPTPRVPQNKKENDNSSSIMYTIETQDGFKYCSTSVADLWNKVFEAVQNARAAHNMPPLPSDASKIMSSVQILGLKTSGLKYLIEQMPGASKCSKYKRTFNFPPHISETDDEFTPGHIHSAIRCAPYATRKNDPYDMFGWLASKHRKPEEVNFDAEMLPRRGSINNLPMAMRFRQLKLTSKFAVGVYRSKIHGRGLFCLRDIEPGEMVIEYAGEVIRSILTDKREKYYNSKGIGCYMFRVDDNFVVDATMRGNAARFINHSCDPNCYSRVVEILGHKHIIIFALRRILCGEELTYDYKFPFEEDKIPCTCGSRRCRKFLN